MIGVGGGFEYGHAGITHHALEDLGIARVQPGLRWWPLRIMPRQRLLFELLMTFRDPCTIASVNGTITRSPGWTVDFRLGRAETVREGDDLLMVTPRKYLFRNR